MDWVGRIFGQGANSSSQDGKTLDRHDQELVRTDLERVNKVRPDLGTQMASYVCEGQNDSVLLTVNQLKKEIAEALHGRGWSSGGKWIPGRAEFLLAPHKWQPDAVRRYGEVLAPIYEDGWPKPRGTKRSPAWFRTLLRAYGEARAAALSNRPANPLAAIIGNIAGDKAPPTAAKEPWTIDKLKSLLGDDETPILDMAFEEDDRWASRYVEHDSPEKMPGFAEHLRSDPERRVKELRGLSAKARSYGLRTSARLGLTDGAYLDFAFDQLGDSAKGARESAAAMLRSAPPQWITEKTRGGWPKLKPAQKTELVRLVRGVCQGDAATLLTELLETEKNDSVRAELTRHLGEDSLGSKAGERPPDGPEGYSALGGTWIAAPPATALPEDKPVSSALRDLLDEAFALWRAEDERYNREQAGQKYFHKRTPVPASATDLFCALAGPGGEKDKRSNPGQHIFGMFNAWGIGKDIAKICGRILNHDDFTLWHLVRAQGRGWQQTSFANNLFWQTTLSKTLRSRLTANGGLRLFADICAKLGDPDDACIRFLLRRSYFSPDLDEWPPEQLWPYFARHFALIDEALGLSAPSEKEPLEESPALDLLALFPKTPARYQSALLDRAIGDRKLVRQPARTLLADAPGLEELLIPLLKHPKSETRSGAASWLAERRETKAQNALLEAARKEKLPAAKAALLAAVSRLGGDIGEFVSADALLKECEEGLKKASTKGLEWFPFQGMPRVKQRNGTALNADVVRWWIVLATKLKEPGGNPWFDLLLDQLDPNDAAKLGLAIMQAWIAYDTVVPSDEEANAYAAQNIDATLKAYQRWQPQTTREQIFSMLRQQKLSNYLNSANDQKGVLSLASRAAAPEAVSLVTAYFRNHYPRTAQCKALLSCLAANPSPVAIQYVLTIAKRWRTRSVQELAGELVNGIADRRGWTAEQLADRTVPAGGFDDAGVLELPIGEKTYTARVDESGKITLFNPDGKAVQGLPASSDNADAQKEAKALLSTARKEVKQVFDLQSRRLYEALCVERDWPSDDWSEFLLNHALMRRLVQRLIWTGFDGSGGRVAVFRPLEDLTLTDVSDRAVDLQQIARIRLAHQTMLTADEVAAWQAHFRDYEVEPLFDQLSRERLVLESYQRDDTEIADRKGWMLETFKLRGIATKLGYTRGNAEDGGWFLTYEKRFDGLQLGTIVEFTGNSLPEENRSCALTGLRFVKMRKGHLSWGEGVPLKTVPPVLLSEAWNDFHAMAAVGTGFDAGWEKKITW